MSSPYLVEGTSKITFPICQRLGPSVYVVEILIDKLLVHVSAIKCDL